MNLAPEVVAAAIRNRMNAQVRALNESIADAAKAGLIVEAFLIVEPLGPKGGTPFVRVGVIVPPDEAARRAGA
jgi:hypothetical protein